jgi:hypothetical protein
MGNASERGPVFQQTGWTVHGSVYNVAGDLVLTKDSSPGDLAKVLEDLKQQVGRLAGLDPEHRREIEHALEGAAREAVRDRPVKDAVVGRLNTVRTVLEAVRSTVSGAVGLAQTVGQVASWASSFLA